MENQKNRPLGPWPPTLQNKRRGIPIPLLLIHPYLFEKGMTAFHGAATQLLTYKIRKAFELLNEVEGYTWEDSKANCSNDCNNYDNQHTCR